MKSIIKYFAVALMLMVMSGCNKLPDGAIATEDNGKIIFTDTTALKQTVMFDLRGKFANFHIDKTRIRQITTIGERSEKIFVLQLSDVKNQVRIVRYVFRKDNEFYLYESLSEAQQKMYETICFIRCTSPAAEATAENVSLTRPLLIIS